MKDKSSFEMITWLKKSRKVDNMIPPCPGSVAWKSKFTAHTAREETLPKDDLFLCLRPVLVLNQVFGALPIGSAVFLNQDVLPSFSIRTCLPYGIFLAYYFIHAIITVALNYFSSTASNPQARLHAFQKGAMYDALLFDCLKIIRNMVILFKSRKLCNLFFEWRNMTVNLWYRREDTKLRQKMLWILYIFFASGILDNFLHNLYQIDDKSAPDGLNSSSFLDSYFGGVEEDSATELMLTAVVPQNQVMGILTSCLYKLLFLQVLLSTALVASIVLAVDQKFKTLTALMKSKINWEHARSDYIALRNFVDLLNDSVAVNIVFDLAVILYFSTLLVVMAVVPNGRSAMRAAYVVSAITHLLIRFLFLCIPAGSIYEAPKHMLKILEESSKAEYNDEAQRLERIVSQPMGISCFGVFTLTKSFILSFANAAFTIVIIILQTGWKE